MTQSRSIRWSFSCYRILIGIYPAEFRREYGSQVLRVFRDLCRDAVADRGVIGLALLWLRVIPDLVESAFQQYSARQVSAEEKAFQKDWMMACTIASVLSSVVLIYLANREYHPATPIALSAALVLSRAKGMEFSSMRWLPSTLAGAFLGTALGLCFTTLGPFPKPITLVVALVAAGLGYAQTLSLTDRPLDRWKWMAAIAATVPAATLVVFSLGMSIGLKVPASLATMESVVTTAVCGPLLGLLTANSVRRLLRRD